MNRLRFRINSPRVIYETIDGETVIIDFEVGNYYSLRASGADVWECIRQGASANGILAALQMRYEGSEKEIREAFDDFLNHLEQEELIVQADDAGTDIKLPKPEMKIPFQKPLLEKFTDMQELLLLDPIHEVDETGWPRQKT